MPATADADPIPRRTLLPFGAAWDLLAVFLIGASKCSAPFNLGSLGTYYAAPFGLGTSFDGLVAIRILASVMVLVLLAATSSQWP
jgi:hypothetical protein